GLNNKSYYEVFEDGEKNIWASNRNGIDIILKGTKKIVKLGKINGLSSDTTRAMTRGPDGRIWVAWTNGVDAVDIRKGKITRYKTSFSTIDNGVKLKFDQEGRLWRGGYEEGVSIIDIKNNTLRHI